jgi:hypothetical protein
MTMYALVLCEPGVVGYIFYDSTSVDTSNAWIKIVGETGNVVDEYDGNDGIPPDFAYVGQGYDGDPLHIQGYEASFPIEPATYNIIAHIEVWYADSLATSATGGFLRPSGRSRRCTAKDNRQEIGVLAAPAAAPL